MEAGREEAGRERLSLSCILPLNRQIYYLQD